MLFVDVYAVANTMLPTYTPSKMFGKFELTETEIHLSHSPVTHYFVSAKEMIGLKKS